MAQIEDFQKRIYGLYQLDWMQQHGWTISDLISSLQELMLDNESTDFPDVFLSQAFRSFENEYGFKGSSEIYCNEDEFFAEEYHDKDYIRDLCSRVVDGKKLYEDYCQAEREQESERTL